MIDGTKISYSLNSGRSSFTGPVNNQYIGISQTGSLDPSIPDSVNYSGQLVYDGASVRFSDDKDSQIAVGFDDSEGLREQHKLFEEHIMDGKQARATSFRFYIAKGGSSSTDRFPRRIRGIIDEANFQEEADAIRAALKEDLRLANSPKDSPKPKIDFATQMTNLEKLVASEELDFSAGKIMDLTGYSLVEEKSCLQKLIDNYNELVNNHFPGGKSIRNRKQISLRELMEIAEAKPGSEFNYKDLMVKFASVIEACPELDAEGEKQVLRTALLIEYALKYTNGAPRLAGFDDLNTGAADHLSLIKDRTRAIIRERSGFLDTLMQEIEDQLDPPPTSKKNDSERDLVHLGEVRCLMDSKPLLEQARIIREELAKQDTCPPLEKSEEIAKQNISPQLEKTLDNYRFLAFQFGLDQEQIRNAAKDPDRLFQFIVHLNTVARSRENVDYKRAAELFVILANLYISPRQKIDAYLQVSPFRLERNQILELMRVYAVACMNDTPNSESRYRMATAWEQLHSLGYVPKKIDASIYHKIQSVFNKLESFEPHADIVGMASPFFDFVKQYNGAYKPHGIDLKRLIKSIGYRYDLVPQLIKRLITELQNSPVRITNKKMIQIFESINFLAHLEVYTLERPDKHVQSEKTHWCQDEAELKRACNDTRDLSSHWEALFKTSLSRKFPDAVQVDEATKADEDLIQSET